MSVPACEGGGRGFESISFFLCCDTLPTPLAPQLPLLVYYCITIIYIIIILVCKDNGDCRGAFVEPVNGLLRRILAPVRF